MKECSHKESDIRLHSHERRDSLLASWFSGHQSKKEKKNKIKEGRRKKGKRERILIAAWDNTPEFLVNSKVVLGSTDEM